MYKVRRYLQTYLAKLAQDQQQNRYCYCDDSEGGYYPCYACALDESYQEISYMLTNITHVDDNWSRTEMDEQHAELI